MDTLFSNFIEYAQPFLQSLSFGDCLLVVALFLYILVFVCMAFFSLFPIPKKVEKSKCNLTKKE